MTFQQQFSERKYVFLIQKVGMAQNNLLSKGLCDLKGLSCFFAESQSGIALASIIKWGEKLSEDVLYVFQRGEGGGGGGGGEGLGREGRLSIALPRFIGCGGYGFVLVFFNAEQFQWQCVTALGQYHDLKLKMCLFGWVGQ